MGSRYAASYAPDVIDRHPRGATVVSGGAAVALVGTFMPWLRSGARNRSSYSIFGLVERLGFAPEGPVAWSLRWWPVVPMLLVLTVIAAWTASVTGRAPSMPITLGAVVALWVGGTSVALLLAPDAGLFAIGLGPFVTVVGVAAIAVGLVLLSRDRSASSGAS